MRMPGLARLGVVSITLKDFKDFNDLKVPKDAGPFPQNLVVSIECAKNMGAGFRLCSFTIRDYGSTKTA